LGSTIRVEWILTGISKSVLYLILTCSTVGSLQALYTILNSKQRFLVSLNSRMSIVGVVLLCMSTMRTRTCLVLELVDRSEMLQAKRTNPYSHYILKSLFTLTTF
jgi:hypothetical protein